jgi:hypothetical protein
VSGAPLTPCPSCARHVRVAESACPFCRAALPASLRGIKSPEAPRSRLSRAAMFALTAAGAAATTACGGMTQAMYGTAIIDDLDGSSDAMEVQGQPHYGAPAEGEPTDGGSSGTASDGGSATGPSDASSAYDGPMAVAAYGISPIDRDSGVETCLTQGEYGCPVVVPYGVPPPTNH